MGVVVVSEEPVDLAAPWKYLIGLAHLSRVVPFIAPQSIQSAAVISWPTRKVRYVKWSSRESRAATMSGAAVTVGRLFARAKNAGDCKIMSGMAEMLGCGSCLGTVVREAVRSGQGVDNVLLDDDWEAIQLQGDSGGGFVENKGYFLGVRRDRNCSVRKRRLLGGYGQCRHFAFTS
jgi:hypothetical protein